MFRATALAMAAFGLLGSFAVATPSFAAETGAPLSASTMLAAMSAPLLAVDPAALAEDEDFSTPTTADRDGTDRDGNDRGGQRSLSVLVSDNEASDPADDEQTCLAASVYFEAKGEPLAGQLAVAETVMNRAASGRFPTSICGVVRQPGQFSFVRGGQLPSVSRDGKAWRQAVAIARIAQQAMWSDVAPNALYFHASRVSPRWGARRVAQLGNHIFYR